jgi:hypothetical protein
MKEASIVFAWMKRPEAERESLEDLASSLGRTARSVHEFLCRQLPPDRRPWQPKRRWKPEEIEQLKTCGSVNGRSTTAAKKLGRRLGLPGFVPDENDDGRNGMTVTEVAHDLGLSRAQVYRLLQAGILRRFKGRIAETTFEALLRDHPECIPYHRLSREMREWLVLNGYNDPSMNVKPPSVRGWLK